MQAAILKSTFSFFFVSVPPESVIILDSKGVTIEDHTLGPYNEGSGINITCVAIGGKSFPVFIPYTYVRCVCVCAKVLTLQRLCLTIKSDERENVGERFSHFI